jgi:hypothetical protein
MKSKHTYSLSRAVKLSNFFDFLLKNDYTVCVYV